MRQALKHVSANDAILVLSLVYSITDISYEWELFNTCRRPIHWWLFGSYACVLTFRLAHLVGDRVNASGRSERPPAPAEFLLDLRKKTGLGRYLAAFNWLINFPFFVVWTLVGTFWLRDVAHATPACVPSTTHVWYAAFWLVLCYAWVLIHLGIGIVAWKLELRLRRTEHDLGAIEDDDVRARWGNVSDLSGYNAMTQGPGDKGLSPKEIQSMTEFVYKTPQSGMTLTAKGKADSISANCECAICICDFKAGDGLRKLPSCGHTFHRACIDLWLLRRADCPLCKCSVRGGHV